MSELRIRDMEKADVDSVVALHTQAMRDFFLTSLGPRFLSCYYEGLVTDDSAIAKVAVLDGGGIAGFAVGTANPSGFYSRLLKRRWWLFVLASLPAVLRRPMVVVRLLRALRYPSEQPVGESLGGLYSIAVDPARQGMGIGTRIVEDFLRTAFAMGVASVYLHADAEGNDQWNDLLRKNGWLLKRRFATPEGREMNEYWIDLRVDAE